MPRVISVIESTERRGAGVEGDPVRMVTQYHTTDGDFLAEKDNCSLLVEDQRVLEQAVTHECAQREAIENDRAKLHGLCCEISALFGLPENSGLLVRMREVKEELLQARVTIQTLTQAKGSSESVFMCLRRDLQLPEGFSVRTAVCKLLNLLTPGQRREYKKFLQPPVQK